MKQIDFEELRARLRLEKNQPQLELKVFEPEYKKPAELEIFVALSKFYLDHPTWIHYEDFILLEKWLCRSWYYSNGYHETTISAELLHRHTVLRRVQSSRELNMIARMICMAELSIPKHVQERIQQKWMSDYNLSLTAVASPFTPAQESINYIE